MRITHIVNHFYPRIGGVEKHVKKVAVSQAIAGHEVTVISGQYSGMGEFQEFDGLKIYRFPAMRSDIRNWLWHISNFKLYQNSQILHVHNLDSLDNIPFFLIDRKKTVLTLHGWGGKFPIPSERKAFVKYKAERTANRIVTVGGFVNKWYDLHSDLVIYGAVEKSLLNSFSAGGEFKYDICILGRLEVDAGVDIYIESLTDFIATCPRKLRICVCGDGTLKDRLEKSLVGADVTFLGFVDNPDEYVTLSRCCLTSGYLGILECLAMRKKVFSVYGNPLKEDYLKLAPFADDINISGGAEILYRQLVDEFSNPYFKPPAISEFVKSSSWENLIDSYQGLYISMGGEGGDNL